MEPTKMDSRHENVPAAPEKGEQETTRPTGTEALPAAASNAVSSPKTSPSSSSQKTRQATRSSNLGLLDLPGKQLLLPIPHASFSTNSTAGMCARSSETGILAPTNRRSSGVTTGRVSSTCTLSSTEAEGTMPLASEEDEEGSERSSTARRNTAPLELMRRARDCQEHYLSDINTRDFLPRELGGDEDESSDGNTCSDDAIIKRQTAHRRQ
mmetsp:Transcript_6013/g.16862  ORF Transcript_6013/g.16862 Transcript_6013/m.16862 type:complete len:211 (+) Transcript_6013:1-633(+)